MIISSSFHDLADWLKLKSSQIQLQMVIFWGDAHEKDWLPNIGQILNLISDNFWFYLRLGESTKIQNSDIRPNLNFTALILSYLIILHNCQFWYTIALFRSGKVQWKCVNSQQNCVFYAKKDTSLKKVRHRRLWRTWQTWALNTINQTQQKVRRTLVDASTRIRLDGVWQDDRLRSCNSLSSQNIGYNIKYIVEE